MKLTPIGFQATEQEYRSFTTDEALLVKAIAEVNKEESLWLVDQPVPSNVKPEQAVPPKCQNCANCCYFRSPLRLLTTEITSSMKKHQDGWFKQDESYYMKANQNHIRVFAQNQKFFVGFGCYFLGHNGVCSIYEERLTICRKFREQNLSNCPKSNEKTEASFILKNST